MVTVKMPEYLNKLDIHFYRGDQNLLEGSSSSLEESLEIIQEKLKSLLDQKNLNFLLGSGTSCNAVPNMAGLYDGFKESLKEGQYSKAERDLLAGVSDDESLESLLATLYSLKVFLDTYKPERERQKKRRECIKNLISKIEHFIYSKINVLASEPYTEEVMSVLNTYRKFYSKIALRSKENARLNIFTTNNDMFNEVALDSLNIHYLNGFSGGINKYFNPANFNYTLSKRMDVAIDKFEPVDNLVYLYKIHGSVNWVEDHNGSDGSFFSIKEIPMGTSNNGKNTLIYPTPLKQDKSLGAPYVDLFREFQHKLLEPNSVIIVIGYSFSDDHVNDIIYRGLATNASLNVVIINDVENRPVAKIRDKRVYRIWSTPRKEIVSDEEKKDMRHLHYFSSIVTDIFNFKEEDTLEPILRDFVNHFNENRKDHTSRI